MERLVARHRMKSAAGTTYLVHQVEDEFGQSRLELIDGSPVEHLQGPLYRIIPSGEVIRLLGSDFMIGADGAS